MKLNLKIYDNSLNTLEIGIFGIILTVGFVIFLLFCIVNLIKTKNFIGNIVSMMAGGVISLLPLLLISKSLMLAEYSTDEYKVESIEDFKVNKVSDTNYVNLVLESKDGKVIQKIKREDKLLSDLKVGDKFKLKTGKEVMKKTKYSKYDEVMNSDKLDLKLIKL